MKENMLQNPNPEIHFRMPDREYSEEDFVGSDLPIDEREIFDYIRDIKDPEHPMSLEELNVVDLEWIKVSNENNSCSVVFKPTIPHCSMATVIGLTIKIQLVANLPTDFKVDVKILPDTHVSHKAISKQLADKERVAAALENVHLQNVIANCLLTSNSQTLPSFIDGALKESSVKSPMVDYIQHSRQHIESYRRWRNIIHGDKINNKYLKLLNYVVIQSSKDDDY